jgi:hypothetical protein
VAREPDRVRIFLDGRLGDLLGRLEEAGVDHLEAGVAQSASHHLRAAVVPIEARLRDDHPELLRHPVESIERLGAERSPRRPGTASVEILHPMPKKRMQFRPPGLKPTTKVGTLGPYRGRLGLAWVVASLVAGVVILFAGLLILTR